MQKLITAVALTLIATASMAGEPTCSVPKDKWMTKEAFKAQLEQQGYKVKNLKVTNGCYELYGQDKAGKRVEISFDPATGAVAH